MVRSRRGKRETEIQNITDIKKLNELLKNPGLEKEFQEVVSFTEIITGQHYNIDEITSEKIETLNQKFDEVLGRLLT